MDVSRGRQFACGDNAGLGEDLLAPTGRPLTLQRSFEIGLLMCSAASVSSNLSPMVSRAFLVLVIRLPESQGLEHGGSDLGPE